MSVKVVSSQSCSLDGWFEKENGANRRKTNRALLPFDAFVFCASDLSWRRRVISDAKLLNTVGTNGFLARKTFSTLTRTSLRFVEERALYCAG